MFARVWPLPLQYVRAWLAMACGLVSLSSAFVVDNAGPSYLWTHSSMIMTLSVSGPTVSLVIFHGVHKLCGPKRELEGWWITMAASVVAVWGIFLALNGGRVNFQAWLLSSAVIIVLMIVMPVVMGMLLFVWHVWHEVWHEVSEWTWICVREHELEPDHVSMTRCAASVKEVLAQDTGHRRRRLDARCTQCGIMAGFHAPDANYKSTHAESSSET